MRRIQRSSRRKHRWSTFPVSVTDGSRVQDRSYISRRLLDVMSHLDCRSFIEVAPWERCGPPRCLSGKPLDLVGYMNRRWFVEVAWTTRKRSRPPTYPSRKLLEVVYHLDIRSFVDVYLDRLCPRRPKSLMDLLDCCSLLGSLTRMLIEKKVILECPSAM